MIILFYYKNSLLSPLTSSPEGTQPARWETSPQSPQPESADPLGSHSLLPHGFRRPGFVAQDRAFQKAPTLLSLGPHDQPITSGKRKNIISRVPSQQEEIVIGSSFFLSRFWWGGGGGPCLAFIEFLTILLLLFWFFGHETCGGLSSLTTDGTHAPCIERQSLKHEVPLGLHFQSGLENV